METKVCTLEDGVWTYTVESTGEYDSGYPYNAVFPDTDNPVYRLITVSASVITDIIIQKIGSTEPPIAMKGCVELLCRLPSMRPPKFQYMKELLYATELGQAGGTASDYIFDGCSSLRCIIGSDIQLPGLLVSAFRGCNELMAVDVSVKAGSISALTLFASCKKLTRIPDGIFRSTFNFSSAFVNCQSLCEALINVRALPSRGNNLLNSMFMNCYSLEKVKFSGVVKSANLLNAFSGCISLKRLIFDWPNWSGSTFSIADCAFEREGLVAMFKSLPTVEVAAKRTITITGNPGVADLTEEDKAIATNKNWALVI